MQRVLLALGGLAIVVTSFFGTLSILNYSDITARDSMRVENAKVIIAAIQKYHASKGNYPLVPPGYDVRLTELAPFLVGGGYLRAMPADPPGTEPIHYVSFAGNAFGLWLHLERSGQCIIEVGASKTGWWEQPPPCQL